MAKEIKDIQQLINDRAEKRLYADIDILSNPLSKKWQFLENILVNIGTSEKPNVIQLYNILTNSGFRQEIFEKNIARYREEEAESFLQKVESIREDVDNLLNNRQAEEY